MSSQSETHSRTSTGDSEIAHEVSEKHNCSFVLLLSLLLSDSLAMLARLSLLSGWNYRPMTQQLAGNSPIFTVGGNGYLPR